MEVISVEYFLTSVGTDINEGKPVFHSYLSYDNEQDACDSHAHMVHLLKTFLESGILVSGMLTVREDTDGCANQYRCVLGIYLITML